MTEETILNLISGFIEDYQNNHLETIIWRKPIVGIASASDPLWKERAEMIASSHALPEDILTGAKSVIAYFIPFAENIGISNAGGEMPSLEWDTAYLETNVMLSELKKYLEIKFEESGFRIDRKPTVYNYRQTDYTSDWSHKTAAYIAGLGKFGLHNVLITEKGCCGRLGSIVTDAEIEPSSRNEKENCLYKIDGSCRKCIELCPGKALSSEGDYDRMKCGDFIYSTPMRTMELGVADTCGKCTCGVPCSFKNPANR